MNQHTSFQLFTLQTLKWVTIEFAGKKGFPHLCSSDKKLKSYIFIHIIMCSVTRSVETWSENVLHCHQKASWRLSRKIWNCQRLTSLSTSNIPAGSRPHFHPYINTGAFPVFFNKVQSLISSFISFPFLWLSDFPLLLFVVSPILPHEKEYRWRLQWTGSVNRESGR